MPQPDYENDLVFPPKSADDLNEQRRQSDVLVTAIEKCEKLEQEVKRLQFENQHVIWLKHRNEALDKDNKRLRQLLKECKEYLSDVDTYCTKNADESYLLITRINAVIGESEE